MEPQALAPKHESFGEFTRRLQDLFTEMELAETDADRELYAGVIQELIAVDMRDKVDGIAAVITKGEAWAAEASRLATMAARHAANADRLKDYVKSIMIGLNVKEMKTPTSRLLVCGNGGVQPIEVTPDLQQLPDEYKTVTLRIPYSLHAFMLSQVEPGKPVDPWLAPINVEANNAALRADLAKVCPKCNGTKVRRPSLSEMPGSALNDGITEGEVNCEACAGSGTQHIPGAKLLPRGKHLRVEGSYLLLEGEE